VWAAGGCLRARYGSEVEKAGVWVYDCSSGKEGEAGGEAEGGR
jgi:hypothetical protein